ncbi:DUF4230 domain-containing protein [Antribacter gilvus]|uniref:DUF4230 domain-containing protein n=1 Tax=Antribacter gilvus TaxID=2304675 RepID=UPI00197E3027|nr:DUF4230 domain-containing protein [Antribacter gilvus]
MADDNDRTTERIERPRVAGQPRGRAEAEAIQEARSGDRFRWRTLLTAFIGTVAGLVLVVAIGLGVLWAFKDEITSALNPFATETVDRSTPPVLLSIKDLARFVAAEGNYEVVVDLEEDTRYVPDWLAGERTLFIAHGSVESYVDFRQITEDDITISEDGTAVELVLPRPELAEPRLDLERSRAISEDRGLINRLNDFFGGDNDSRQEVLAKAEEMLGEAAGSSDLEDRAEENTRKTLAGMLTSLGFETVTVTYEGDEISPGD